VASVRARLAALERRAAINLRGGCPRCGGDGSWVVRILAGPPEGPSESGSPCPACGKATVIEIVDVDAGPGWAARDREG
jgi:hypothetical protein